MTTGEEQLMSRVVKVALLAALMLALSAGVALAATIVGTAGNDSISVGFTGENDLIVVLEGKDFVDPYDGNDTVYGNEGNDIVTGAEDSDTVYGNTGRDTVDLAYEDTIAGSTDQGFGGKGNDQIGAQDGNFDAIDCGAGDSDVAFTDVGLDTQTNCESVNPTSVAAPEAPPASKR
jgi:Ca2+-binding RTX toxin-like protein